MDKTTGNCRRRWVRRTLATTVALTIGVVAGSTLDASAAATPTLTLTIKRDAHVEVKWQFDPLAERTGSKLEIQRSVNGGAFAQVKLADRPSATGAYTDKNVPQGLLTYKARLKLQGVDQPWGPEKSIQFGTMPTTPPTIPTTTPTTPTSVQQGTPGKKVWAIAAGTGTNYNDIVHVTAVEPAPNGDIIVGGDITNKVKFGTQNLETAFGEKDGFIAIYAPNGTLRSPVRQLSAPKDNGVTDLAVDANGDIVAASFQSGSSARLERISTVAARNWTVPISAAATDIEIGSNGLTTTVAGASVKVYDAAGTQLWTASTNATLYGVDVAGTDVVVTGQKGTSAWAAGYQQTAETQWNQQWEKSFEGSGPATGTHIAVAPNGDVVMSGYFENTIKFGTKTLTNLWSGAPWPANDIYIARRTPARTYSVAQNYGSSTSHVLTVSDLDVDSSGNITFAGIILWATDFGGGLLHGYEGLPGQVPDPYLGGQDGYVVKLKPTGASAQELHVWSKRFLGINRQNTYTHYVAALPNGRIAVGGSFAETTRFDGTELTSVPSSANDPNTFDGYLALFEP